MKPEAIQEIDPVWESAIRMWDDGYSAMTREDGTAVVVEPKGMAYTVSPLEGTCTCGENRVPPEKRACKHLLGLVVLLQRQTAHSRIKVAPYKRHFAVWDEHGELVAVTVYRRGALSVAQRLSSLSVCPDCAIAREVANAL